METVFRDCLSLFLLSSKCVRLSLHPFWYAYIIDRATITGNPRYRVSITFAALYVRLSPWFDD